MLDRGQFPVPVVWTLPGEHLGGQLTPGFVWPMHRFCLSGGAKPRLRPTTGAASGKWLKSSACFVLPRSVVMASSGKDATYLS